MSDSKYTHTHTYRHMYICTYVIINFKNPWGKSGECYRQALEDKRDKEI